MYSLSQKNLSTAFEQLNRCLNDVKQWMSTSNLILNPNKAEYILFLSVKQFGYGFAFDAAALWNALPDEICVPPA